MNPLKVVIVTACATMGVLLLVAFLDLVRPHKPIEVIITPDMIISPITPEQDNWVESAAALGIDPDSMTVQQFIDHNAIGTLHDLRALMVTQQ